MSQAFYKQIKDLNDKMDIILTYITEKATGDDVLSEEKAAEFLGITKKTLQNKVSLGTMVGKFTINAAGKRMYYKSKLIHHFGH